MKDTNSTYLPFIREVFNKTLTNNNRQNDAYRVCLLTLERIEIYFGNPNSTIIMALEHMQLPY